MQKPAAFLVNDVDEIDGLAGLRTGGEDAPCSSARGGCERG